jgi:GNAT superfamily N-acetyltransferase
LDGGVADDEDIRVVPVTVDGWVDVETVFGSRGYPAWCWCQYFVTTGSSYTQDADRNRQALHDQLAEPAVRAGNDLAGLIAYRDDDPVGWLQLGPRARFPRVTGNRAVASVLGDVDDDEGRIWRVTCFVVRVGHRRHGVAKALLAGAVEHARRQGATVLEGHPVDPAVRAAKVSSADLYHGVFSMFLAAGFTEVGRTAPSRPLVRLEMT